MLNNLLQMYSKLLQKQSFEKQQTQMVIWLVIKLLIKIQKSRKVHHGIIQRQLKYTSPEETQKIIDDLKLL